ncbi:MAG: hypothetical protein OCD00_07655 [Colwellia sp.]
MNNTFSLIKRLCTFILLMLIISPSLAVSVADLVANNALTVKARLSHHEIITARTPITISVEVATNRWFAKGTRIVDFTLAQTIVLPFNELAINGTKKIKGTTWATQIREITLYPMKTGVYHIPAITISVSVNTEKNGIVSGIISTKSLEFEVSKPDELTGITDYIVSSEMRLTEQSDFDPDKNYQIGEALTQTIIFTAQNVPGMMLPVLPKPSITGISVYHKQGEISDKSSRGVIKGSRTESFTYIFEQVGNYSLAEQKFYWWNSASSQLEVLVIPKKSWIVVAAKNKAQRLLNNKNGKLISFTTVFNVVKLTLIIALVLFLFIFLLKHRKTLYQLYSNVSHQQYRKAKKQYLTAINIKDYPSACHYLYVMLLLLPDNKTKKNTTPPPSNTNSNNSSNTSSKTIIKSLRHFYIGNIEQSNVIERLLAAGFNHKENNEEKSIAIADAKKLLIIKNTLKINKTELAGKKSQGVILNPMND